MEGKDSPWILESSTSILRMESQSASIATSMDI